MNGHKTTTHYLDLKFKNSLNKATSLLFPCKFFSTNSTSNLLNKMKINRSLEFREKLNRLPVVVFSRNFVKERAGLK